MDLLAQQRANLRPRPTLSINSGSATGRIFSFTDLHGLERIFPLDTLSARRLALSHSLSLPSRARSVLSRRPPPQHGQHACKNSGHIFDESKTGVRCINDICDDRQCCLPPTTCATGGGEASAVDTGGHAIRPDPLGGFLSILSVSHSESSLCGWRTWYVCRTTQGA
jgi:hypothetical protein